MNAAANPFATARVERLLAFDPELIGLSWEAIDERWAALGQHACVTGHHGSGKSTLLAAMADRLAATAKVESLFFNDRARRLSERDRRVLERCEGVFLMIDGDRHLPWGERRELVRAARRASGSLFARHSKGGLPELVQLRSSARLAELLLERISPEWQATLRGQLARKLARRRGNLRELWLECYDLAANADG